MLTVLDVDVSPSVAVKEAGLGSLGEGVCIVVLCVFCIIFIFIFILSLFYHRFEIIIGVVVQGTNIYLEAL